jgi:DNA excision repair protein ERCC-2
MKVYFPYEKVRSEQQNLIKDIAQNLHENKVFLAHAPTGLGKTVSSLAPAIAHAKENGKKIFFLTPKISQHEIVLETVNKMNEKFGLDIRSVDLIGKRNLCLDPFVQNVKTGFYDACSKRKKDGQCKHYINTKGKTNKQKVDARKKKRGAIGKFNISASRMKDICETLELCPYELLLEQIKSADIVMCDYSHVFDSMIRSNIFESAKIDLSDVILIIDEAHNLPERIRNMYSMNLGVDIVELAAKEARSVADTEVDFILKDIEKEIISLGKNLSLMDSMVKIDKNSLEMLRKLGKENLEKITEAGVKFMKKTRKEKCALMSIVEFLEIFLHDYENVLYLVERKNAINLTMQPLDVSEFSRKVLNEASSAVLMSGTLLPLNMYSDVLGVKNATLKEYNSPFPKENRLNLFVTKTTTRYTDRNEEQYNEIASVINSSVVNIPGNVIVFFPSFELLETISPKIKVARQIFKQEREQSLEEKESMLHKFKLAGNSFGAILLAVSGGTIAEGMDFPGDHLIGTIIVGVPFARVNPVTKELIKFYDDKFRKGWDYAYNAPAISKAVQASGRVIRTETDKGVCVFLDTRFSEPKFRNFYPSGMTFTKTLDPQKEIVEFFK